MGKDKERYSPPEKKEDFYSKIGISNPNEIHYVSTDTDVPFSQDVNDRIEEQRWQTVGDRIGRLGRGFFGPEEKRMGMDVYEEPVLDQDNVYRTYKFVKDKDGVVHKLGLADPMDGVRLEDVVNGLQQNPALTQYYKEKLFGKIMENVDPITGKLYEDTSKGALDNAVLNSMTAQLGILGARIFGDKSIAKYGTFDPIINKINFSEDGDVTYSGTKLNLKNDLEPVADWLGKKTTFQSSGFLESFFNTGATFLIDAPLFYVTGMGAGKLVSKIIPEAVNTLPVSYARHLAQNFGMLTMASTPGIINHRMEGGMDALLEDIKHTAEFSFIAGTFGLIGEQIGLGVSKLMQSASPLTTDNITSFLKKNPNLSKNLISGFTSGALGYVTSSGTQEEKLSTGMVFMAMHFSSPEGWKNFMRGDKKNVMVEKDNFQDIINVQRSGGSLQDALLKTKALEPKYYEREGDKLYYIDSDAFINKGEVVRISDTPITLDRVSAKNYNYLAESIPFAKKTLRQSFQEKRIDVLRNEILEKGFKDVVNPYDKVKEKEQYESFEYNKNLTATQLALNLYSQELYKTIKQNGLPNDAKLHDFITTTAEGMAMPRRVFEQMLLDYLPTYLKDPEGFKASLKEDGGSLKFLPEEYRKSFESALDNAEQSLKRYANSEMIETLTKAGRYDNTFNPANFNADAITLLRQATEMQDVYRALEKAGYSSEIFDRLREKIKAETTQKEEFREKIKNAEESVKNETLNTNAGRELVGKEYRYAEILLDTLTPKEISEIGRTGVIPEETRTTFAELEKGLSTGSILFPSELLPTDKEPIKILPESIRYGKDIKETRQAELYLNGDFVPVTVRDYYRDETGAKSGYVVEDGKGNKYAVSPDKIYFSDENSSTDKYDVELGYSKKGKIAKTGDEVTREEFRPVQGEFWRKFKEKLYGEEFARSAIYPARASKLEENDFEPHRRSVSEFIKAIKETLQEIGNEKLIKFFDEYDHIWKIADKMPEVFTIMYNNTFDTAGAVYHPSKDGISLNMKYLTNNFTELRTDLAHEIMHAIISGGYKGKDFQVARSMNNAIAKDIEELRSYLFDRYKEDVARGVKTNYELESSIDYALNPGAGGDWQELVTTAFTDPEFARWLSNQSARPESKLRQEKGSVLQYLRDKLLELLGINRNLPKTAMDELTEIINNKFVEWGVLDAQGNYQEGVRTNPLEPFGGSPIEFLRSKPTEQKTTNNEPSEVLQNNSVEQKNQTDTNILPENNSTDKTNLDNSFARKNESTKGGSSEREKENSQVQINDNSALDFESKPREQLPDSEPESKSRKVEKEEDIKPRAEIAQEREKVEKDYLNNVKILNKNKAEEVIQQGEKAFDYVIRNTRLYDFSRKVKDYLYQSIVPVFRKDFSPRFERDIYTPGEEMIRYAPYHFNSIVKRFDGWAGGEAWRKFTHADPVTGEARSKEGLDFLKAFKDYEYARYTNKIPEDLTWEKFATWAGFNDSQKKMLEIYRASIKAGIDKMKELKVRYLTELDPNLYSYVSDNEKSLAKYGFTGLTLDEIKQRVDTNQELKKQIAQNIIDEMYLGWDKNVYYNSIRPVTKDTTIVEMSRKSLERKDKDGNFLPDQIRTYFTDRKEALAFVQSKIKEGWTKDEMVEVKDIVGHSDQWGKLSAQQLMQLAEEGHIEMSNEIIQKLMEVTKKGVDTHTIHKEYVPGMKYTAKEFEGQFERFLREAIYGGYKSYALTKINDNLNRWRGEINESIRGLSKTSDKGTSPAEIQKLEEEYKYSYGYYNQLKAPEKTVIDKIRGLTFSYLIGGVKPAFLFQQSTQGLQTTLHLISAELNKAGFGGFGEATKLLGEASAESVNAMLALRARKKGLDLKGFQVDENFIKVLHDLDLMSKLKEVGISELSGIATEPDFYYSTRANKMSEGMIRLSNALGGGIEKFTRVQAAGMYYKLGKRLGLEGDRLLNYVAEGLDKSMSEFGKGGRAPVFDSKSAIPNQGTIVNALKKAFLTLKTFSYYNYGLYHNLIKGKQWGAVASKSMVGLGMHGIAKFPLMAGLFAIAELFTDDDIDYTVMRLADELDAKTQTPLGTLLRGGVGAPFGVDMREMMGESSPLITDVIANTWSPSWEGKLLEVTLGAPLGFSKNMIGGTQDMIEVLKDGIMNDANYTNKERRAHLDKVTKVAPLWLGNIIRSFVYEQDGVHWNGKEILSRDDLSSWDIFLKAMSFPVDRINRAYIEGKDGIDAQIGEQEAIIKRAKLYMREVRDNKNLDVKIKLQEIDKAETSMKQAKQDLINLEKQKRERNRE